MLKVSKEKRQINQLEKEKKNTDAQINCLNQKIEDLRAKIKQLKDEEFDHDDNLEKLSNLYKLGIINEDGQPINNEME